VHAGFYYAELPAALVKRIDKKLESVQYGK
jgi:hypothetical protein